MIVPASGRKPLEGSSVVMRHCIAKPLVAMSSWRSPIASNVSPAAICSCMTTRSMSVTSSVTVCSTWMRGFISMKT